MPREPPNVPLYPPPWAGRHAPLEIPALWATPHPDWLVLPIRRSQLSLRQRMCVEVFLKSG